MAGDWMKVEEATPDKPEIAILARRLGVSIGDAFLNWFRLYRWAGRVTGDPGFVRLLSAADADQLSGAMPGTCGALASAEVGWIEARADGLMFVNWDRHNSKSAKARALDSISKRHRRANDAENVRPLSGSQPDESRTRQEESKRKSHLHNSNGESIGSASKPVGPLRKEFSKREFEPDLSDVEWSRVVGLAETIARKIPPLTDTDRRNWFRFGVLVQKMFSEAWLMESVEAVLNAKATKKTKQAHLYSVLRAKAEELGTEGDTFASMLGCIEIPSDVWKSGVLEIRK